MLHSCIPCSTFIFLLLLLSLHAGGGLVVPLPDLAAGPGCAPSAAISALSTAWHQTMRVIWGCNLYEPSGKIIFKEINSIVGAKVPL